MTSVESFDSNAVEADGIRMEIIAPDLVALAIPENQPGVNAPFKLSVSITNNTTTPFRLNPYQTFIPQLVASNGQALHGQVITDETVGSTQLNVPVWPGLRSFLARSLANLAHLFENRETREINYLLISPGESKSVCLTARLSWQNNLLQLKVPTILDDWQSSTITNKSWLFDELQPGAYQFRFIYESQRDTRLGDDSNNPELRNIEEIRTGQLATSFLNLRLVQPIEPDNIAIEVDGIRFETLVPERVLTVPKKNVVLKLLYILESLLTPPQYPSPGVSVQIGIRITNNTSIPFRFDFQDILIPELVGVDGQISWSSYCIRIDGSLSDFPLIMPGESITFFPDTTLFWLKGNQFALRIAAKNGFYWFSEAIKLGTYQVRFTYSNKKAAVTMYGSVSTYTELMECFWIGEVSTPFVEVRFVQS